MKLTNLQLTVLVNNLFDKVQTKINALKATSTYYTILDKVKRDSKYDEKVELILKREKLESKIEKLREQSDAIKDEYKSKFHKGAYYYFSMPNVKDLDDSMEQEATKVISKDFPTKANLESDIILLSMERGGTNIISELTTKYSL